MTLIADRLVGTSISCDNINAGGPPFPSLPLANSIHAHPHDEVLRETRFVFNKLWRKRYPATRSFIVQG